MTIKIHLDFETYSEAGFNFDGKKWRVLPGLGKTGIGAIGAHAYSVHPSTAILSMAYKIGENDVEVWTPDANVYFPYELEDALEKGAEIHAWNSMFEFLIWENVGVPKYGFPPLPLCKFKCTMAKARAYSLPGSLKEAAKVLKLPEQKKEGALLLKKFSVPRNPTKNNPSTRNFLIGSSLMMDFLEYNKQDVVTEHALDKAIPDLSQEELEYWQLDQVINQRGVCIDIDCVNAFISVLEKTLAGYNEELARLTNGKITSYTKLRDFITFINETFELKIKSLNTNTVNGLLTDPQPPPLLERLLTIRRESSKSSVKKLYALKYRASQTDGELNPRLRGGYMYYGARTGRTSGAGVQPQNLPNASITRDVDRVCAEVTTLDYDKFIALNPDPLKTISACIRSLFIAPPGKQLIVSDYSAIEAVVLAVLARETWRINVFKSHGKIYEESVARITRTPLSDILNYYEEHKKHHPLRKFGKVAELAAGYQGGVSAWARAGALDFIPESQLLDVVRKWRSENPNIVDFWYSVERCAVNAIRNPFERFTHNDICFFMQKNTLFCELPSKRLLVYHNAQLDPENKISFEMWNSNQLHGKMGWVRMSTYGGKLTENIVQATARDILMYAIKTLENAGFPVVLHTHDEIVCEMPEIENALFLDKIVDFEKLMTKFPPWATHYPIKAAGGFISKRYRK